MPLWIWQATKHQPLGQTNQIGCPDSNLDVGFVRQLTADYNIANIVAWWNDTNSNIADPVNCLIEFGYCNQNNWSKWWLITGSYQRSVIFD